MHTVKIFNFTLLGSSTRKKLDCFTEFDYSGIHYYALVGLITIPTEKVCAHYYAKFGLTSMYLYYV